MTILLTGANGQIGWELARSLCVLGEVIAPDRSVLDLADRDAIVRVTREVKPALIVNPGAFTAVDLAESQLDKAMAVNGIAPGVLAEQAKRLGAGLIHFSTDYVFDGSKSGAYTENDVPRPMNAYGRTKLAGEEAISAVGGDCTILRTSWIYSHRGTNFLRTIRRLARERPELRIVNDQRGCPTWARVVADAATHVAREALLARIAWTGLYHVSCAGETTWYEFARAILAADQTRLPIRPITSAEYPTPARRPANSALSSRKFAQTFGLTLPRWEAALALCLATS